MCQELDNKLQFQFCIEEITFEGDGKDVWFLTHQSWDE